jgi:hypothetical protein
MDEALANKKTPKFRGLALIDLVNAALEREASKSAPETLSISNNPTSEGVKGDSDFPPAIDVPALPVVPEKPHKVKKTKRVTVCDQYYKFQRLIYQ